MYGPVTLIWGQFHKIPQPLTTKISFKITHLEFTLNLQGADELMSYLVHDCNLLWPEESMSQQWIYNWFRCFQWCEAWHAFFYVIVWSISCNGHSHISGNIWTSIVLKIQWSLIGYSDDGRLSKNLGLQIWNVFFQTECRVYFIHAPSQWETILHCNIVSHWLVAYTK